MSETQKLRIAFIDPIDWDYGIDTPYGKPLGGTQSGVCYLAEKLAGDGHAVTLFNEIGNPGKQRGVDCRQRRDLCDPDAFDDFDCLIVVNGDTGLVTAENKASRPPTVLWMQNAHDQPAAEFLNSPEERNKWTGFAFVSEWQRNCYMEAFDIEADKSIVTRNAIAPTFENITPDFSWLEKKAPPALVYTSTPFRGLDVLLFAFPKIREAFPDVTLKVFSGMSIYQDKESDDPFEILYKVLRQMDGVDMVGAVSQGELANQLASASILSYPNTFAETSCISVMEAMAAGCIVLTSELGALPETTAGFGFLLPPPNGNYLNHSYDFSFMACDVIGDVMKNPGKFRELLETQVDYARREMTWGPRAKKWAAWLVGLVQNEPHI